MIKKDYEIVSVEATSPPNNLDGSGWHCYVIGQGDNLIRGYKQGSLEIVRQSAQEIVMRLNERRFGKRGRVHLDMSKQDPKVQRK